MPGVKSNRLDPGARPLRAGLYYRVSSEEQVDGFSLDAQRRLLVEYCAAKGWQVSEEYADEGKSARTDRIDQRPAFKRLLEDVADGTLDVVIVHKIDRFARNIRVTFEALELLARHNVAFVAVAQPDLDYTRPEGRLFMGMMATLAQYYSDNLSQETKKGMAERKRQGLYNGRLPFGLMKGPDGVPTADPATIDGLLLAFELAAEGRSDRAIAEELNRHGYRVTTNGRVNPFSKDTVAAILQNRFYLGELPGEEAGQRLPGRHAPVIAAELFGEVAERRRRRAFGGRATMNTKATTYSLSGLCTCGCCGAKMRIQPNRGKPRVFCTGRQQTNACTAKSGHLADYEAQIAAHLATFAIPIDYRERLRAHVAGEQARPQVDVRAQRQRIERRLERIRELFGWGDLDRTAYLAEREQLQRELMALAVEESEETANLDRLALLLADASQGWALADQGQRHRLATLLFEEVVIDAERQVLVKPHPELAGFFELNEKEHRLTLSAGVHASGSDGDKVLMYTHAPLDSDGAVFYGVHIEPMISISPQKRARIDRTLWPIIADRAQNESLRDLAVAYGVSHTTIQGIVRRVATGSIAPR